MTKEKRVIDDKDRHKPYGKTAWRPVDDVYINRFYPRTICDAAAAIDMLKKFQVLDFTPDKQPVYIDLRLNMKLEKKVMGTTLQLSSLQRLSKLICRLKRGVTKQLLTVGASAGRAQVFVCWMSKRGKQWNFEIHPHNQHIRLLRHLMINIQHGRMHTVTHHLTCCWWQWLIYEAFSYLWCLPVIYTFIFLKQQILLSVKMINDMLVINEMFCMSWLQNCSKYKKSSTPLWSLAWLIVVMFMKVLILIQLHDHFGGCGTVLHYSVKSPWLVESSLNKSIDSTQLCLLWILGNLCRSKAWWFLHSWLCRSTGRTLLSCAFEHQLFWLDRHTPHNHLRKPRNHRLTSCFFFFF